METKQNLVSIYIVLSGQLKTNQTLACKVIPGEARGYLYMSRCYHVRTKNTGKGSKYSEEYGRLLVFRDKNWQ